MASEHRHHLVVSSRSVIVRVVQPERGGFGNGWPVGPVETGTKVQDIPRWMAVGAFQRRRLKHAVESRRASGNPWPLDVDDDGRDRFS